MNPLDELDVSANSNMFNLGGESSISPSRDDPYAKYRNLQGLYDFHPGQQEFKSDPVKEATTNIIQEIIDRQNA